LGAFFTNMTVANKQDRGPELAREVMRYFFVPPTEGTVTSELGAAIRGVPAALTDVAEAFVYNLEAAVSTVSMPAQLAMASAQRWRFQQLHIAERIRARSDLGPDGEPTEVALKAAWERANAKMAAELSSKEGVGLLADSACDFLLAGLRSKEVSQAAAELLLQGAVLVWGAFEVLAREVFVRHLNSQPDEAARLVALPEGRRLFQLKTLDVETLAAYDFDLSAKMGTVLASAHDLANLPALKTVFQALFPGAEELHRTLDARDLWVLTQRRHLIVHQRGIVDRRYLANTNDAQQVGERLSLAPDELMRYVVLVQSAGAKLLAAVIAKCAPAGESGERPTDRSSGPAAPAAER
jgi:hypothetical protein